MNIERKTDGSMDNKFNSYEYHTIRKFSAGCHGRKCNIIDRMKIHNKTSIWHELLSYLQSPDGVLKIYKVECRGQNNNCMATNEQTSFVVRPYVSFSTSIIRYEPTTWLTLLDTPKKYTTNLISYIY